MKQVYSYNSDGIKGCKCLLCKAEITQDELEYEDYFVVFRGHSEETFEGFICFACIKERG